MLVPYHVRIGEADGQWIARIVGRHQKYGWDRRFVHRYNDWSESKRTCRGALRDVTTTYMLHVGAVYEFHVAIGGTSYNPKLRRFFATMTERGPQEIDESEVLERVESRGEWRKRIGLDVLSAARQRIAWTFERFPRVYLSGPSGKDSGVVMHLVCQEARRRGRTVGVLYVDLEAQYTYTIDWVRQMFAMYSDVVDPHWVAIPLRLRNAVSMEQPYWVCWDPWAKPLWVRQPPPEATTDPRHYPFYQSPKPPSDDDGPREAMEFEEFVEQFGLWYAGDEACACFVALRTDESLNRWRTIVRRRKSRLAGKPWTSWKGEGLFNIYPIYDWRTEDVWTYYGREKLPYNQLYDKMYRAGLSIHQARICQPYGDDQRRGLNMFHVIEPETWSRVVARVAGANSGALYAGKQGNILGNGKVELPEGHTWESFTKFLLDSLPEFEAEHYRDKIAVFIRWWQNKHNISPIPDAPDPELAKMFPRKGGPSWYRIAKCILKNDRNCRSLSFDQHKSANYARYRNMMRKRREQWGII